LLEDTLRAYCRAIAQERLIGEHAGEPPWASDLWRRAHTRQETLSRKLGLSPVDWLQAPQDATLRKAAAETVGEDWIRERLTELGASVTASAAAIFGIMPERPQHAQATACLR